MQYILNADHSVEPMADPVEWHERMQIDDIIVGRESIGESTVTTSFTGLEDGTSAGRPLVFETYVQKGALDGRRWRWATYKEAEEGHKRVVAQLRLTTRPR